MNHYEIIDEYGYDYPSVLDKVIDLKEFMNAY